MKKTKKMKTYLIFFSIGFKNIFFFQIVRIIKILFIIELNLSIFGCALFKTEPTINKNENEAKNQIQTHDEQIRFSENPNIGSFNDRRYHRVTRKTLEDDSDVGSRAGSLWNTEGPSAYLFTQNKLHREGDLLAIKIEGNAKTQIDTKIQVIKKLLARLDIVPTATDSLSSPLGSIDSNPNREPASINAADGSPGNSVNQSSKNLVNLNTKASPGSSANVTEAEADAPINVDSIPTRVTERMPDGNYRVKGQQSFMIGKKEFRVIVTGLVRPEDFADEGIGSNKLLDPQLDVVSLRRNM